MTSSATTLSLGLAHSNIYPIYGLLDHVKGLVLWNDSHGISMTRQDIQKEF